MGYFLKNNELAQLIAAALQGESGKNLLVQESCIPELIISHL